MNSQILEVYNLGLEKYAGDETKAKEFTVGFLKEAAGPTSAIPATMGRIFQEGAMKALGAGAVGLGLGLGIHGLSSTFNAARTSNLRDKFLAALSKAKHNNPILEDVDSSKVQSYAETVFKFAPHVAADPNLLTSILANAVHGEGIDPMTIRTLADLEGRIQESQKNALFSPKAYT
jgi:hypothetical protein